MTARLQKGPKQRYRRARPGHQDATAGWEVVKEEGVAEPLGLTLQRTGRQRRWSRGGVCVYMWGVYVWCMCEMCVHMWCVCAFVRRVYFQCVSGV